MWRKKKWIIIAVVGAVVILAVGIVGGVTYAQSGSPTSGDTLMARVAKKLNINQSDLEKAFKEAQREMNDEALSKRLEGLVQQGKITQEQADKYQSWWKSRPDVAPGLDGPPNFGPRGPMRFPGGFKCPMPFGPPPNPYPATPSTN